MPIYNGNDMKQKQGKRLKAVYILMGHAVRKLSFRPPQPAKTQMCRKRDVDESLSSAMWLALAQQIW